MPHTLTPAGTVQAAPSHPAAAPLLGWPPAADEARLQLLTVRTTVRIAAGCASVHAYASNASRWHTWHPATRSVEPLPDRPLGLGETVTEHIQAGGRRFTATWTVVAVQAPTLWVIATATPQGLARIVYTLTDDGSGGARFERTLQGRSLGRWQRWFDPLMFRLVLVPQSRRALEQLKARVEAGPR